MYQARKKTNGRPHPIALSEKEKQEWETHPLTRGKWVFEEIPEKPKIQAQAPIEAKDFSPKKPKEHKTRKK